MEKLKETYSPLYVPPMSEDLSTHQKISQDIKLNL